MDWSSMQAAVLMMPANDLSSKLEEAIQFLQGPDFIPTESQPAQVIPTAKIDLWLRRGGDTAPYLHFTFPTPRPCEFVENNVVHGRLYRCAERWQERPVIILLPGWNDSASYKLRFPLIARRGNRAGFNVVTLVPPYHFQRCPAVAVPPERARPETVSKLFGSTWQLRANFGVEGLDEAVGFSRSGCLCSRREMVHKFVNSNGALFESIACEELAS
jgi:hypothetical protein